MNIKNKNNGRQGQIIQQEDLTKGIMVHMVDTHSLWDRGAKELNILGKSDKLIINSGRWSSLIFLEYTHEKIDHLSKGVSTDMSNQTPFHNIGPQ